MAVPARLEWWGDDVSSIRGFDLTTQRSLQPLDEVTVLPVSTRSLTDAAASQPAVAQDAARAAALRHLPDPGVGGRRPRRGRARVERGGAPPGDRPAAGRGRAQARCDPGESGGVARATRRRSRVSRCATSAPDLQFGFFPPEKIDRDLNRLRSLLAGTPAHHHPLRQRRPARAARRAAGRGRARRHAGDARHRRARRRVRHAAAPGAHRPRDLPPRAAPPPGSALPAGGAVIRHRRPHPRRLRGPSRPRDRDLPGHPDHHGRRVHDRGGHRGVRGRRPAQRSALPAGPARALSGRRRGRRPAAAQDPPAGRLVVAAGARADAPGDQADGGRAARPVRAAHRVGGLPLPAGRQVAARAREQLPVRGYARPAEGHRRGEDRHGAAAADGPAAGGRRRLRQDGDRGAGGVQGGAGRQAGRRAGAHHDSRGAARPHLHRAARRLPGQDRGALPLSDREGAEGRARASRRRLAPTS